MKKPLAERMYLAFHFEFEHNNHTITARASGLTGQEEILVDGESVSKKRSLRLTSRHQFVVDGIEYQVQFRVKGFLLSTLECSLAANGDVIDTQARSATVNKKNFFRNLIIFFVVGMVFGYLAATLALDVLG